MAAAWPWLWAAVMERGGLGYVSKVELMDLLEEEMEVVKQGRRGEEQAYKVRLWSSGEW